MQCKLSSTIIIIIIFRTAHVEKKREKSQNNSINRRRLSRRRLKFTVDQSLRIEYNVPLAKDFQVTLSGGGAIIRHKVAFFAEDEAATVVALLENRGVQVIRRRGGERSKRANYVSHFFLKKKE